MLDRCFSCDHWLIVCDLFEIVIKNDRLATRAPSQELLSLQSNSLDLIRVLLSRYIVSLTLFVSFIEIFALRKVIIMAGPIKDLVILTKRLNLVIILQCLSILVA